MKVYIQLPYRLHGLFTSGILAQLNVKNSTCCEIEIVMILKVSIIFISVRYFRLSNRSSLRLKHQQVSFTFKLVQARKQICLISPQFHPHTYPLLLLTLKWQIFSSNTLEQTCIEQVFYSTDEGFLLQEVFYVFQLKCLSCACSILHNVRILLYTI